MDLGHLAVYPLTLIKLNKPFSISKHRCFNVFTNMWKIVHVLIVHGVHEPGFWEVILQNLEVKDLNTQFYNYFNATQNVDKTLSDSLKLNECFIVLIIYHMLLWRHH